MKTPKISIEKWEEYTNSSQKININDFLNACPTVLIGWEIQIKAKIIHYIYISDKEAFYY